MEAENKTPAPGCLRASVLGSPLLPFLCPTSPTFAGERANHILLTGQSFVIFLLCGSSAVGKRQRGDACRGAVMYGGFSHCLADGDTFPEDDVLLPVPEG